MNETEIVINKNTEVKFSFHDQATMGIEVFKHPTHHHALSAKANSSGLISEFTKYPDNNANRNSIPGLQRSGLPCSVLLIYHASCM